MPLGAGARAPENTLNTWLIPAPFEGDYCPGWSLNQGARVLGHLSGGGAIVRTPVYRYTPRRYAPDKAIYIYINFGETLHVRNFSKTHKEKYRKGAWPRSHDPLNFRALNAICANTWPLKIFRKGSVALLGVTR